jgi:hypothetical protein
VKISFCTRIEEVLFARNAELRKRKRLKSVGVKERINGKCYSNLRECCMMLVSVGPRIPFIYHWNYYSEMKSTIRLREHVWTAHGQRKPFEAQIIPKLRDDANVGWLTTTPLVYDPDTGRLVCMLWARCGKNKSCNSERRLGVVIDHELEPGIGDKRGKS